MPKNPADMAMPYLNQIPGTLKPYYSPYINAGKNSLTQLQGQYNQLLSNPGSLFSQFGEGYEPSPGYQFNFDQAMNASNNAAAAGGLLGTPGHQQQSATLASNLANQDFHNYIAEILQLYGLGLHGEEDISHMGYGASNELANSLGNNLLNQGNLAFQGQANQNQIQADQRNGWLGLGGTILGGLMSLF